MIVEFEYVGFTDQARTDDVYRFTTAKEGVVIIKGSYSADKFRISI